MLVYGCITPHGAEVIPKMAGRGKLEGLVEIRKAMRQVAEEIKSFGPDTIIVATPHNLRLLGRIGVVTAENSSGMLGTPKRSVRFKAECDVDFARKLLSISQDRGLPVVGASYGSSGGAESNMPMDWGTLVPLWFLSRHNRLTSKIAIVTPSREIPLTQNFEFGSLVAELAEKERKKKYVFVASADQAHTHRRGGPYGFSRFARTYDGLVVEAIESNDLVRILDIDGKVVHGAKPDSLWQMAMLAGAMARVEMKGRIYAYQVTKYYGMLCAGFRPS
jgi:aromatic ring-opening dioxygenase LigB subunit